MAQNGFESPCTYKQYTVAVICAMSFEMSAVRYMLDREHPRPRNKDGDSNSYVVGELAGHNVALACLPGTQGKGAAAIVTTNMARTFPSIKYRFLVGIGGGVPSNKHPIHLGDVVVAMPDGEHGGVVQYDLGRDTENGFDRKGFLLPPPSIVRSAVELMRSDHLVKPNEAEQFVSSMLNRGSRLSIYRRPSTGSDLLFEANYTHASGSSKCENCDMTRVVTRTPRDFDGPEIHYGLIASGDRVIKSAAKAMDIAGSVGDLLCFEMEAAGFASEFPCAVIRGISDYADSHKNDGWQHYAAATAAACAKELLSYIDPVQLRAEESRPIAAALDGDHNQITSSVFYGQGVQNTGSGNLSIGGKLHIQGQ